MTKAAQVKKTAQSASDTQPVSGTELNAEELAEIRSELDSDLEQMRLEYAQSMADLDVLRQSNTDGAGDDQADVGSKTFEREQEQSIAANRYDLLLQTERAIARIDSGIYGMCEECGKPIPKERLKAIPMATLDAQCKARLERR